MYLYLTLLKMRKGLKLQNHEREGKNENNIASWIPSRIFSTLTEETQKNTYNKETTFMYKPFFELLKNNSEFRKDLSKFLSNWYVKNHNQVYVETHSKEDEEMYNKIKAGDSELWTEEFWNDRFFPVFENVLDDGWASLTCSKDVILAAAACTLRYWLNDIDADIYKSIKDREGKWSVYKFLHKDQKPIHKELTQKYIPDLDMVEYEYRAKAFKTERLESIEYIKAKDELLMEIQNLFQDALDHNNSEINNIETAEKVFQFFSDRGVLDTKDGRHIVSGSEIVLTFISDVYSLKNKLAWGGISKIDRDRASFDYYNPYFGEFFPNKFTIVATWKDKIVRFPIGDIYFKKHGRNRPKIKKVV